MIRIIGPAVALFVLSAVPASADDKPVKVAPTATIVTPTTTGGIKSTPSPKAEGANDKTGTVGSEGARDNRGTVGAEGADDKRGIVKAEGANDNRAMGGGVTDNRGKVSAVDGYMAPKPGTATTPVIAAPTSTNTARQ